MVYSSEWCCGKFNAVDLGRCPCHRGQKKSERLRERVVDSPSSGVIMPRLAIGRTGRIGPRDLCQVNSSSPSKAGVCPAPWMPSGVSGAGRSRWRRSEAVGAAKWCVERHKTRSRGSDEFVSCDQRYPIEEFDPGSERTLAAWLRHASRTSLFCRKAG